MDSGSGKRKVAKTNLREYEIGMETNGQVFELDGWFEKSGWMAGEGEASGERFSERHLQCLWADDRLRPPGLTDERGRPVEVVHAGEWNSGPGPDFLRAILRIGGEEARGDVEIHIRAGDWKRHGHGTDGRYKNVCAHVTWHPGGGEDGPPGAVRIALKDAAERMEGFSFDTIDLMAYPVAAKAEPPPCRAAMGTLSPAMRGAVLDAAGEARLRRRAEWLREAMRERGTEQALYEAGMGALGYRANKTAFLRLARLVPLEALREKAAGDVVRAYAVLAGCGGLLPDPTVPERGGWDEATRSFLRQCWDAWWPLADEFPRRLEAGAWTRAGIRPANAPERRLMAAAMLFGPARGLPERLAELAGMEVAPPASEWTKPFELKGAPYWEYRLSFATPPVFAPVALVGEGRAKSLAVNLVVPAMAALGAGAKTWRARLGRLPADPDNALARETAERLFGADHPPGWYRSGLRRQGLIHIHHEYCLSDRSRCEECPYPAYLRRLANGSEN